MATTVERGRKVGIWICWRVSDVHPAFAAA
jgi:hypothetical protein